MPNFSGFDPKSLLTTTVKAKLDTKIVPIPLDETDEFLGLCTKVDTKKITARTGSEEWLMLSTNWQIMDDHVKKVTGLDKPTARYEFFLDVDPVKGLEIGKAKNVKLGRLLEAVGINGKEWSLSMIEGLTSTIKIVHETDENDPEIIYNKVVRVGPSR